MKTHLHRQLHIVGYALLALSISGCAVLDLIQSKRPETASGSDQELLSRADAAIARKKHDEGRTNLQRLINQFPESELVPTARLTLGRSYFNEKKYEEARAEYQRFLELFPQHERVDEARYYIGLSYIRQMEKTDRDQALAKKAVAEFQTLTNEFRDSQYAPDARAKIVQCRRQLADKELYIGKFYFNRGSYGAAIKRFETVLKEYPGSEYDDQALYYLGESLWELEQKNRRQDHLRTPHLSIPGFRHGPPWCEADRCDPGPEPGQAEAGARFLQHHACHRERHLFRVEGRRHGQ